MRAPQLTVAMLAILIAACSRTARPTALDRLHPCPTDEGPSDAYCGTLAVFENRETRAGRRIDLKIVVLPALDAQAQPDPLFLLAGGPGQGAAQMADAVHQAFRSIQRERDVVLVDQRGTGKSNPLDCRSNSDSLRVIDESDDAALDRLRQCLAGYDADVRLY